MACLTVSPNCNYTLNILRDLRLEQQPHHHPRAFDSARTMLPMFMVALAAGASQIPRPEIYYVTAPTLPNETLLVAGAGLNTSTSVRLCRDPKCLDPLSVTPTVWYRSIQITLPAGCGPPCFLQVDSDSGNLAPIALNAPDVWFATSGSPSAYGMRPQARRTRHPDNAVQIDQQTYTFLATGTRGDLLLGGGAQVTSNPLLCLRSGSPHDHSTAAFTLPLNPGTTVHRVSLVYRYTVGYGAGTAGVGANFSLSVGDTVVYASPAYNDFPYSKSHPNYSNPVPVDVSVSVPIPLSGPSQRLVIRMDNNDRNLQLLLPLRINVSCSGRPCVHAPPPPAPRANPGAIVGTIVRGDSLRVFGRALAWVNAGAHMACVNGSQVPTPMSQTILSIDTGSGRAEFSAASASCYEATFALDDVQHGSYNCTVRTAWGSSTAFLLNIMPGYGRKNVTVIDVAVDCQNNFSLALARAREVVAVPFAYASVVLGSRQYSLDCRINIPDRTSISGRSASSGLSFTLLEGGSRPALTVGYNVSLENFTLTISAASNQSLVTAVLLPAGRMGLRVRGLTVTMAAKDVGVSFDLQGSHFEITDSLVNQSGACHARTQSRAMYMHAASS